MFDYFLLANLDAGRLYNLCGRPHALPNAAHVEKHANATPSTSQMGPNLYSYTKWPPKSKTKALVQSISFLACLKSSATDGSASSSANRLLADAAAFGRCCWLVLLGLFLRGGCFAGSGCSGCGRHFSGFRCHGTLSQRRSAFCNRSSEESLASHLSKSALKATIRSFSGGQFLFGGP